MEPSNWSHNRQGITIFAVFITIVAVFYVSLVLYAVSF